MIVLRLDVDEEDRRARRTYQALGLRPGGCLVFEEIRPERTPRARAWVRRLKHSTK
ncbi:MAG TPA: hypothetical protein VKP69_15000 [Isosphaeraceae bacterium]|nr:hypothetical protein [Isosphaeraceae bacterium]